MRRIRCAIYTRKSTEEGLEQDFNSLDAQREACEAYVASQKHEGWELLADHYDDGGISGGHLDRPALRRLMQAVDEKRIDRIVVYKIDRLTRSLADFAKLVDRLDAAEASFVSVRKAHKIPDHKCARRAERSMTDGDKITVRMAELGELDRSGLRVAWQKVFDNAPPHFLSMLFMRKALIWDAQCKMYGGIPANLKRALKSAAGGKTPRAVPAPTLRPGTQLVREWNGHRYQVDVTKDGYRYNGGNHRSLSAIALLITGTTWSGPRFFGLTRVTGAHG